MSASAISHEPRQTAVVGPWKRRRTSMVRVDTPARGAKRSNEKCVQRLVNLRREKGKMEMPPVLTIGHSTRTWKDFLALLRAHRVKRVIDVRSIPRSRHNPQFNRETLSKKLRAARIGYVHLRKLGGLRHARRNSPNMGWRNNSFRGFADYMQTSEFEAGLHRLMKLAGQKRSAIMCAEAVPWRCHRSLIADALTVRGIRVDDITSMKRSQVHSLIAFARVRGHRITYPVGDGSSGRIR